VGPVTAPVLTDAQYEALRVAATRKRGNVCPTYARGAAQTARLKSLRALGYIADMVEDGRTLSGVPVITDAGRAALTARTPETP
jgi:hypothetical protein